MGATSNQLEARTDHEVDEPDEGAQDVSIDEANRSGATVYPRGRREEGDDCPRSAVEVWLVDDRALKGREEDLDFLQHVTFPVPLFGG